MYTITYEGDFDEKVIDKALIRKLIEKHETHNLPKLRQNMEYYLGKHAVENKSRAVSGAPNIKTVCNHAKDIADTASGYFMGSAITYSNTAKNDEAVEPLLVAFDEAEADDADSNNALDMAIYGVAYEYIYPKEDETVLTIKSLEPEHTFFVYDDTIEQRPLFLVYYHRQKDDAKEESLLVATVLTTNYKHTLKIEEKNTSIEVDEQPEAHNMGQIPVVEFRNNKHCIGDFEQQISLIDAYNTLMSDRINDKEQFIDALLVLYGARLGDDAEESREGRKALRREGLIELPEDAKLEYLVNALDEEGAEVLRKAVKEDIYTFSHVPNLSDENFVGNSSGVAMEFKLLGLEMLTKIKERWYKKGLRKRIAIFCTYLGKLKLGQEANSIVATLSRGLPKNLIEIAQMVLNLKGTVSQRTLLKQIPFVEDPDDEATTVGEENDEAMRRQKAVFETNANTPPPDDGHDQKPEKKPKKEKAGDE